VRYTEIRNRDTDDSVNSLVDLLKDDDQPKKRGFFGRSKKKNIPKEILPDSRTVSSRAVPEPTASRPAPAPAPSQYREIRRPESNDSVDSLVDLLKNDGSSKRSKGWGKSTPSGADEFRMSSSTPTPVRTAQPAAPKPSTAVPTSASTAKTAYRTVPGDMTGDAVGGLVDLLKSETGSASSATPKIFKSKTYTKVSTTQPNATVDVTPVQDSNIPKPSVSEPKVYKPTASKSFEEKAASPNARPVETTATITKPLEAKAISTKPSETKSVEAKNVEAKAVVTPKPETAPAPEAKQEEPMDDFKRRLMMAHLIPDGEESK
jgi:hypothetical protein